MQEKSQRIHPESPHRTQRRGEYGKKQNASPQDPQAEIQAQLTLSPVDGEKKDGSADSQTVENVQRRCQPGELQTESPQQVIQQGGGHAQQDGLDKGLDRLSEGAAHGASPKEPAEKALPLLSAILI